MNATVNPLHTLAQVHSDRFTFELTPNSYKLFLSRLWFFLLGFFLPMLTLYCCLLQLDMAVSTRAILLSIAGVVLGGLFLNFRIRGEKTESKSLLIQDGQLVMEGEKGHLLALSLSQIKVEQFGWGPEADCLLPAVRIWTSPQDSFTIGALRAEENWKEIKASAQATDYVLENWQALMQALNQK